MRSNRNPWVVLLDHNYCDIVYQSLTVWVKVRYQSFHAMTEEDLDPIQYNKSHTNLPGYASKAQKFPKKNPNSTLFLTHEMLLCHIEGKQTNLRNYPV